MRRVVLAVFFLVLACTAAVTPAYADAATDLWTYTFTLPTIVNGAEQLDDPMAQWSISFLGGPFGSPAATINTFTSTGSPLQNGWYSGGALSSGTTVATGNQDLISLTLMYSDGSGTDLAFAFLEPNSFWATTGANLSFNNGSSDSAYGLLYEDPSTGQDVFANTNTGASYATWNNDAQADPPCDSCSVTITDTPQVVTPEPSSFLLLGSGLLGFAGMVRWKVKARLS